MKYHVNLLGRVGYQRFQALAERRGGERNREIERQRETERETVILLLSYKKVSLVLKTRDKSILSSTK